MKGKVAQKRAAASPSGVGEVIRVMPAVVDVEFPHGGVPEVLGALESELEYAGEKLVLEVAQHLGDRMVRCVAMGSTDSLSRGDKFISTGNQMMAPVGRGTLGRVMFWAGR